MYRFALLHDKESTELVGHAGHIWEEWHGYLSGEDTPSWVIGSDSGICCHTCATVYVDRRA